MTTVRQQLSQDPRSLIMTLSATVKYLLTFWDSLWASVNLTTSLWARWWRGATTELVIDQVSEVGHVDLLKDVTVNIGLRPTGWRGSPSEQKLYQVRQVTDIDEIVRVSVDVTANIDAADRIGDGR